ncbi:transposase [Micromonospora sp. NPDC050695]|uniref:transposase n=1 Tax=Micromonospora sp. NPDC050695 TaxID=3154938 RepID=UPI003403B006
MQRQYSGTAVGELSDRYVPVLCLWQGAGVDHRKLYLPKSWTEDRRRCRDAAIPDEVAFATKPQQARAMLERAIAAGVPFAWFTAAEAYGQNPGLRGWLREQDVSYVKASHYRRRLDAINSDEPPQQYCCGGSSLRVVRRSVPPLLGR